MQCWSVLGAGRENSVGKRCNSRTGSGEAMSARSCRPESRQIAIVVSSRQDAESLSALLEENGYTATNYLSAWDFLDVADIGAISGLLIDADLPDMDGFAILDHLRGSGLSVQPTVLLGPNEVRLAVRALRSGAYDYIERPASPAILLDSLEQGRREAGPSAARHTRDSIAADRFLSLSDREVEVLRHLVSGARRKEIAARLGISHRTVEVYLSRISRKMQARSTPELIRLALAADIHPSRD